MSQHAHGHAAEHSTDSHGGLAQYIYVFIALCVLTSASFFTYSDYWPFPNQPKIGWAFMMAVSCTKAMLVILFFMHVKYEASWKYVLTIPAGFMSIFLILALVPDIGMRGRWASEEREQLMANPRVEHKAPVRHSEPRNEHSTEAPAGGEGH
jgi:cytochrome c oxidase subunit 4